MSRPVHFCNTRPVKKKTHTLTSFSTILRVTRGKTDKPEWRTVCTKSCSFSQQYESTLYIRVFVVVQSDGGLLRPGCNWLYPKIWITLDVKIPCMASDEVMNVFVRACVRACVCARACVCVCVCVSLFRPRVDPQRLVFPDGFPHYAWTP